MSARSTSRSLQKPVRSVTFGARARQRRTTEELTALSIMYQAERQDKTNNVLASLALIAAALAYLGIAALLLGDLKLPGGSWTPAFLAFPLWIAASFQVLLVWSGLDISKSLQVIEQKLVGSLGYDSEMTPTGAARAAGQALNFYRQPPVMKIQSIICIAGVWAVVIFFSAVCLAVAAKTATWISAPVITAGTVYTLFLAGNVTAWLYLSKVAREIIVKLLQPR